MNILKSVLIVALVLSILLNLYLAIKLIDAGISLSHRTMALESEVDNANKEFELLSLLLVDNLTRQEIIDISNRLSAKGILVKNRKNLLQIGRLEISFNGDKVATVEKF